MPTAPTEPTATPLADSVLADSVLAHPVLEHSELLVSPPLVASVLAWLVFVVALALPERAPRTDTGGAGEAGGPTTSAGDAGGPTTMDAAAPPVREVRTSSWAGSLSRPQLVTRVLAVLLLVAAIVAGRAGSEDQLENLAPALVVGTAWPLLVLASITVGQVWRWCDPWDGLARLVSRGAAEGGVETAPGSVWPAVLLAVPWMWFLSATSDPLDPRWVGGFLAVYTAVTLAGCVAAGRRRWLSRAEPLGVLLSWMSLLPRGGLASWTPPRGAEALLGVLVGGLVFGVVRRSQEWGVVDAAAGQWLQAAAGLLASCLVATAVLLAFRRISSRVNGQPGVARAMVPALAGVAIAVAMGRNRLSTSLQLLPGLAGDPLGAGWDLLGPALDGLVPEPLGTDGLLAAQLVAIAVGHLAGAVVLAWRQDRAARMPAVLVLTISTILASITVPLH